MIKLNGSPIKLIHFPAGEVGVNVSESVCENDSNTIYFKYENDGELIQLLMVCNAVRAITGDELYLEIPYIPYGRQDRICNPGEAFGLWVVTDLLNYLDFDVIFTYTPHSDVTTALLNVLTVKSEMQQKITCIENWHITHLVSPDAGALKRVYQDAKQFTLPLIECSKKRDVTNGNLQGCKINDDLPEEGNLLIIDDICDGGGTFILLAEAIKKINPKLNLYLYVSHGLFTKGLDELQKHFKGIACAY